MNDELKEKLYAPFEVSVKPGQGGYKYVRTSLILDRMNELFGTNWATNIVSTQEIGEEILAHVRVSILDDKGYPLSWQEGYGSAKKFGKVEIGNLYKSAVSKAQKTALRNWGIALHLDSDTTTGSNSNSTMGGNAPPLGSPVGQVNNPPMGGTPPTKGGFVNTTPHTGSQGTDAAPVSDPPTGVMPSTPFANTPPTNSTSSHGFPPTQAQPQPEVAESTELPVQNQGLPSMAPPAQSHSNGAPSPQLPSMSEGMANAKVTSIQKIVLDQRMKTEGKTFKEFATAQFAALGHTVDYPFENVDDLLYKDALLIVAN